MKNKIVSLFTALGLLTNVAVLGNSAKVGYASDFFYRGEQKALESFQSSVDFGTQVAGLEASLHACTNQSVDSGVDSYGLAAGFGTSVLDGLLSAYVGFNHFEDVPGSALSEVAVSVSVDSLLDPSLSVFRNIDDDLYTFEASVSHDIDLKLASLGLDGSIGSTDVTESDSREYYSVGLELSRPVGSAEASVGVDLVDADDIDREFVFSGALTFEF
jgi:hypothetical protein